MEMPREALLRGVIAERSAASSEPFYSVPIAADPQLILL